MKTIFILLITLILLSCSEEEVPVTENQYLKPNDTTFGYVEFATENYVSDVDFVGYLQDNKEFEGVIAGEISKVCQSEGCWITMNAANKSILVLFKDKFAIPKDTKGKKVFIHGKGMKKEDTKDRKDSDFDIIYFANAVIIE